MLNKKKVGILSVIVVSMLLMAAALSHFYLVNVQLANEHNALIQKYNGLVTEYNVLASQYNNLATLLGPQKATFKIGQVSSLHARIRIWKAGVLILDEYHAGAITDIGDNMTIFWTTGDTDFQVSGSDYSWNISDIGIGNQGTLNTGSTVLPGEWNRTAITTWDNKQQSIINASTTIYPDAGGAPYTADCIGLYFNATGNYLWGYDTFTEVTGIDETFTITVEFQLTFSHAA